MCECDVSQLYIGFHYLWSLHDRRHVHVHVLGGVREVGEVRGVGEVSEVGGVREVSEVGEVGEVSEVKG